MTEQEPVAACGLWANALSPRSQTLALGPAQAKEQAEYNRSQKAKEAMEAEGGDDMAKAEAFLQMTTAKLTKAGRPRLGCSDCRSSRICVCMLGDVSVASDRGGNAYRGQVVSPCCLTGKICCTVLNPSASTRR